MFTGWRLPACQELIKVALGDDKRVRAALAVALPEATADLRQVDAEVEEPPAPPGAFDQSLVPVA